MTLPRGVDALTKTRHQVGALYLTNLICLIPVTVVIWATNEAQGVAAFPRATDPGFQVALFWSAALAGLMNYLVFLSAAVNSPLTTSITGQVPPCLCVCKCLWELAGVQEKRVPSGCAAWRLGRARRRRDLGGGRWLTWGGHGTGQECSVLARRLLPAAIICGGRRGRRQTGEHRRVLFGAAREHVVRMAEVPRAFPGPTPSTRTRPGLSPGNTHRAKWLKVRNRPVANRPFLSSCCLVVPRAAEEQEVGGMQRVTSAVYWRPRCKASWCATALYGSL